jgi:hypothetical protein
MTTDLIEPLAAGDAVEVRNRFDGRWARGFRITRVTGEGFRLRRASDRRELPDAFPVSAVRRPLRRPNSWYEAGAVRSI